MIYLLGRPSMAALKTCFKCSESKPRTEFYAHKMMDDGLLGKCKECAKRDVAARRQENIEAVREYDRQRSTLPHRVALRGAITKRWLATYPDRRRAQILLGNALKRGDVKRQPCWICGATEVEGHHPDYSAPLDVVWLCVPHHRQTHAMVP